MPFRRYADFNGRSRRMEYWMWVLFNLIIAAIIAIPLTILVMQAFWRVEERGGVSYQSSYGSSSDRYDSRDSYRNDDDSYRSRDEDRSRDDDRGSRYDDEDRGRDSSEDGNSDKISSRAVDGDASPEILAYSYSYRGTVDVDPFMFIQEFGPIGWILVGLLGLWWLITLIPNLAVAIRRLHDTDRSGWWLFIGMIPLVGTIILLVFMFTEGTRGPNRFGPDPKAGEPQPTYT